MESTSPSSKASKLIAFVTGKVESWRNHRDTNYLDKWQEYERVWRGIFAQEDRTKSSERSKIISPATQQAIENIQAEIEEAVFGNRKEFFDIEDDGTDPDRKDIIALKRGLSEAFKKDRVKKYISQVITLGQVYGTGIGELQMKEKISAKPATEKLAVPEISAIGVRTSKRIAVELRPIVPQNFLIDPNALDIEDAFGCAVEEYISMHAITKAMDDGIYRSVDIGGGYADDDRLERSQEEDDYKEGKCKVIRYFGLIPASLLEEDSKDGDVEDITESDEETSPYDEEYENLVEAVVVIGNGSYLLKADKTPYMMEDRPIVVYRPEIIPGRFWGRGTAEKGFNMQKGLDGQLRAHLDSVALTAAPMVGIDATRMPRGFKFEVSAGRSIFTNGNPAEVLMPLTLGQTTPVNVDTANLFERFLQQATGTIDSAGLPQQVGQQSDPGAMAMALSGLIKKNKRALINFQEDFLIPFVEKAAWRYMQFDPENFPVKDFYFFPITNMGIMAREYEQQQFIGLLQTLGPDSKITPLLMAGILENSSLSNKDELVEAMKEMAQDTAEQEQQQQLLVMQAQAEIEKTSAEAEYKKAEAAKTLVETKVIPIETQAKLAAALSTNLDDDGEGKDFERRLKLMELSLKGKEIEVKKADMESNERITAAQLATKKQEMVGKAMIERRKLERDAEGNLTVTKTRE